MVMSKGIILTRTFERFHDTMYTKRRGPFFNEIVPFQQVQNVKKNGAGRGRMSGVDSPWGFPLLAMVSPH